MVLNQLKKIREELKNSADNYDNAFKNAALIAATELVREKKESQHIPQDFHNYISLNPTLDKKYFVTKYGSLKNAKEEYKKKYGKHNYGRSWSDFIAVARELSVQKPEALTLEERITKIENFLLGLGYQP